MSQDSNQKVELQQSRSVLVYRLVMLDIKNGMKKVTDTHPINNSGSFALTILWQIYEKATVFFEQGGEIKNMDDNEIELVFHQIFPSFIEQYPLTLELDA